MIRLTPDATEKGELDAVLGGNIESGFALAAGLFQATMRAL